MNDELHEHIGFLEETIGWDAVELQKRQDRIAELEKEAAQWQESCGQNYVRATEAEMREEEKDKRIAELEARNAELDGSRSFLRDTIMIKVYKLERDTRVILEEKDRRIAELEQLTMDQKLAGQRLMQRIAKLEAALTDIRDSKYCDYESQPATSYGTGVVDGHRFCADIARNALEGGND